MTTATTNRQSVSRQTETFVLICVAVLLHAADSTLVATLIVSVVEELNGVELIPWATILYELGTIITGTFSGLLAIRHGIKLPLAICAFIFAIGCLSSASATSMPILLVGRLLQGLGGGGLIALAFITINIGFSKRLIPMAIAIVSVIWGVSAFLGPLIGALFVEYYSWRSAFLFFSIIGFLLASWLILFNKTLPHGKPNKEQAKIPIKRLLLLSIGICLVAYASINVSIISSSLLVAAGVCSLAYFLKLDSSRQHSRLLPRNPVNLNHRLGAGLTMILCFSIATTAFTVYGPIFLIKIHQTSVLTAGIVVACIAAGWSLTAFIFAKTNEQHDQKLILIGMIVILISNMGFVFTIVTGPFYWIVFFALLEGAGFGMSWAFILRFANKIIHENEKERLAAAMPTLQRTGYSLGSAYIGIIANATGLANHNYLESAYWVFAACLPFGLLGLFAVVKFVKPKTQATH